MSPLARLAALDLRLHAAADGFVLRLWNRWSIPGRLPWRIAGAAYVGGAAGLEPPHDLPGGLGFGALVLFMLVAALVEDRQTTPVGTRNATTLASRGSPQMRLFKAVIAGQGLLVAALSLLTHQVGGPVEELLFWAWLYLFQRLDPETPPKRRRRAAKPSPVWSWLAPQGGRA